MPLNDNNERTVLPLSPLQAVADLGWSQPTLIQEKAIPLALEGKDLLARARTGSGKTAAYAVPVIQRILASKQVSRQTLVNLNFNMNLQCFSVSCALSSQVCAVFFVFLTTFFVFGVFRAFASRTWKPWSWYRPKSWVSRFRPWSDSWRHTAPGTSEWPTSPAKLTFQHRGMDKNVPFTRQLQFFYASN